MTVHQLVFEKFPKIPRAAKVNYVVTEKIDGTNAQLLIVADPKEELKASQNKTIEIIVDGTVYLLFAGSRNRWITPDDDNFNFAQYVYANAEELVKLGPGRHFGEWYGSGIQRGYGLDHKRWALFNAERWTKCMKATRDGLTNTFPMCNVDVVPILGYVPMDFSGKDKIMKDLKENGSVLQPGFMEPEGIILHNHKYLLTFKDTYEFSEGKWKGQKE